MLIRSQDKKRLVNFDNVKKVELCVYVKTDEGYHIYTECENNCFVIFCDSSNVGEYSTEEKAIKVLDMICAFVDEKHFEQIRPNEGKYVGGEVFQMPQDEEVEE